MDVERERRLYEALQRALAEPPERRESFVAGLTDFDEEERGRLLDMIRRTEEEGDGAATSASAPTTVKEEISERPGSRIGPYKLLQVIGEGGFGIVFLAEQEAPVRRRVALKVIKPGMDTRQVVARFEQERQALALMDHPNIARVFDGGSTKSGRPYFVMELVRGDPITAYCDRAEITPRSRRACAEEPLCTRGDDRAYAAPQLVE